MLWDFSLAISKQECPTSTTLEKTTRELLKLSEESDSKYILDVEQNEVSWWRGGGAGGGDTMSNPILMKVLIL